MRSQERRLVDVVRWRSCLVATTLVVYLACDVGERKVQIAWGLRVMDANVVVQELRKKEGALPDQVPASTFMRELTEDYHLVRYIKESDDRYVIWIARDDLGKSTSDRQALGRSPGPGDIYGVFGAKGALEKASWREE